MDFTFTDWMAAVDELVTWRIGLSVYDLEDCPFSDWFDSGMTAKGAARQAIRESSLGAML